MITCGLDIGSGSTKGVLLEDSARLLARVIVPTKGNMLAAAKEAHEALLRDGNLMADEVDYLCTTGAGRYAYPDRQLQVSDITASGRGAVLLFPGTRHVIDVGAQSSRAIAVDARGKVLKFKMNERCAAGAGRFIERCSKYLQIPLDGMGTRAMSSTNPRLISSVCAVLAETEIINYIAEGIPVQDILMGIFLSLSQRAHSLMRNVGVAPQVTLVGGLVHNPGVVAALTRTVAAEINASADGHYAAAAGAALLGNLRRTRLAGA